MEIKSIRLFKSLKKTFIRLESEGAFENNFGPFDFSALKKYDHSLAYPMVKSTKIVDIFGLKNNIEKNV